MDTWGPGFTVDRVGWFLARPHRFMVLARDKNGEEFRAHCANPGRMAEFLTPEYKLLFQKAKNPKSKLPYSLVAIEYCPSPHTGCSIVPLQSSVVNPLSRDLILPALYPEKKRDLLRSEVSIGSSRFDFVWESPEEKPLIVEVKSCSLVENRIALFPDAPSQRALRHLKELEELQKSGNDCLVLFVITHGDPRVFRPMIHTDPEFSKALASTTVPLRSVSTRWNNEGFAQILNDNVPIDTSLVTNTTFNIGCGFISFKLTGDPGGWILGYGEALSTPMAWAHRIQRQVKTGSWRKHIALDPHDKLGFRNVYCEAELLPTILPTIASFGWAAFTDPVLENTFPGFSWFSLGKNPPEFDRRFLDLVFSLQHR